MITLKRRPLLVRVKRYPGLVMDTYRIMAHGGVPHLHALWLAAKHSTVILRVNGSKWKLEQHS